MTKKFFAVGYSSDNEEFREEKISMDVVYQEKYNEMRRHRDYELSTANWCKAILLAIIGFFISLKSGGDQHLCQISCNPWNMCIEKLLVDLKLKLLVFLIIFVVVFSGSKIIKYSHDRYEKLRDWTDENLETKIDGKVKKFDRSLNNETKPYKILILMLLSLGLLAVGIVFIL